MRLRMDIDFGRWLARQRTQAGLTQKDVAAKCHLSDPYITRLESGSTEPPPLKTCKALARALGIQWEELWRRAFVARLEKWVRRQGFSRISSEALLEISKRIEEGDKQAR
jgi:transcriptional regulator with XRE-family HTH domain